MNDGLPLSCAIAPSQVKKRFWENLIIRASQESQPSDVIGCWLCIVDGLPLSCALTLLSRLLCLPEAPGALIGFNGHFPCKVALKILLRHPIAASLEVIIPLPSLADGPVSIVVDVSSVCILFLVSCLSPHQHALLPSEVTKGFWRCRAIGGFQDHQLHDVLMADR